MQWLAAKGLDDDQYVIPDRWLKLHYFEALNVLFRVENALRILVYVILKSHYRAGWADVSISAEGGETTIKAIARQRENQASTFGYLGYPVTSPLMYLTTGELIRAILSDAYWPLFKLQFPAGKQVLRTKFEEIVSVRNALAHFRPISADDVGTIKQVSKHVLTGVEETLAQLLSCPDTVPTNTAASWYSELRVLGTDQCRLRFSQSANEQWYRIDIEYSAGLLREERRGSRFYSAQVMNLNSPAIFGVVPDLASQVIYLTENVHTTLVSASTGGTFGKTLHMGFARAVLHESADAIRSALETLLERVSREAELIEQDNLARGELVRAVSVSSRMYEQREWSVVDRDQLASPYSEGDPPEWWGEMSVYASDFISAAHTYPWMPTDVARMQFPF